MRKKLPLLISTALPAVHAAWLPAAADIGVRRAHAGRTGASIKRRLPWEPEAQEQLQAVCDRRSRTCRVYTSHAARSGPARMQQTECKAPPPAGTAEMATQYSPAEVEQRLYEWWEKSGYFEPAADSTKECFVISMPPPNVTGKLHMGHAMFVALEDIMARFVRTRAPRPRQAPRAPLAPHPSCLLSPFASTPTPGALSPHARPPDAVASGHRPRRHRDPDARRALAPRRRHRED